MHPHIKDAAADAVGFGLTRNERPDQPGPRAPDGVLVERLAQAELGEESAQGVGKDGSALIRIARLTVTPPLGRYGVGPAAHVS